MVDKRKYFFMCIEFCYDVSRVLFVVVLYGFFLNFVGGVVFIKRLLLRLLYRVVIYRVLNVDYEKIKRLVGDVRMMFV